MEPLQGGNAKVPKLPLASSVYPARVYGLRAT